MLFLIENIDKDEIFDIARSKYLPLSTWLLDFINEDFNGSTAFSDILEEYEYINNESKLDNNEYGFYTLNRLILNYLESIQISKSDTLNGVDQNISKEKLINLQINITDLIESIFMEKNNYLNLDFYNKSIDCKHQIHEGKITEVYDINTIDSYCIFAITKLLNSGFYIKKCVNCNSFFIPKDPREIYCDSIYVNNRTCKDVGYDNKMNSDEVLKKFRRIYKNKNAQKNRNKNNPNVEKKYEAWINPANENLEKYRNGEITSEEFNEWLDNN